MIHLVLSMVYLKGPYLGYQLARLMEYLWEYLMGQSMDIEMLLEYVMETMMGDLMGLLTEYPIGFWMDC